jgi:hypothetical protein
LFCEGYVAQTLASNDSWKIVYVFLILLLAIVLSVLRFTASDYPFDIFKLF